MQTSNPERPVGSALRYALAITYIYCSLLFALMGIDKNKENTKSNYLERSTAMRSFCKLNTKLINKNNH